MGMRSFTSVDASALLARSSAASTIGRIAREHTRSVVVTLGSLVRIALLLLLVGCQRVVTLDADASVAWLALITVDDSNAIIDASGILPVDAPLPRQPNDGRALLFGFRADQIDRAEPMLAEP